VNPAVCRLVELLRASKSWLQEGFAKLKTVRGIVRGKTIELEEDLGVSEGQTVEVQMKVVPKPTQKTGEGFLRTEGALVDDPYWDGIMVEIYQERKEDTRRDPLE
jgi:hypothetical protein